MPPFMDGGTIAAVGEVFFGPRVPVPEDADPQTKLLALFGRDAR